ncbi:MAG TPA: TonB-dependent receptor [Chitinophagaceae bacterium]|nr:TonB-dependent receptor [Chitinophagaceae bacterium]
MKIRRHTQILLAACLVLHAGMQSIAQEVSQEAVNTDTVLIPARTLVNIGFGKIPSQHITSSIAVVKGDDINKAFNLNVGNNLYGRLAGVHVAQGGSEPGAAVPSLFIRGRNTFGDASTTPLYVIDGFISNGSAISNAFMQLVPEEIESITVLKDAASTAIYGSRGANGVVLVTTKRAKQGPLQVSFSTRQGYSQAQQLPKFLNAYDYARLYNEARVNDGLSPLYTQADLDAYQSGSDPYFHSNVNWYDEVLRKAAPVASYDLTLSGGDPSIRYFVVLNAVRSGGLYKAFGSQSDESSNSNYGRYNFRTNLDVNLTKRFLIEFSIAGAVEQKNNPYNYTTASTFDLLAALPPNAFPVYNANGSFGGSALYTNPFANLLSTGFYQTNARTVLSSLKLTQQLDMLTPGLSVSAAISLNSYFRSGSAKTKQYARYAPVKTAGGADSAVLVSGSQKTSLTSTEETLDQYRNTIIQGFLQYNRNFGKHSINALLMFNRDEVTLFGPVSDPSNPTANSTDPYRSNAGAARINYVYNEKYIAEFSGSYMASNLFPKGNRGGLFPAGSVGWIASNENFLRDNKTISFLKLRGAYGLVGNDLILGPGLSTRYSVYTQTFGGNGYVFGTSNQALAGNAEGLLANPNVTWEREKTYNIGVDATFFHQLDLSLDYFNRDRYNILVASNSTLPQYLGAVTPFLNQGKANNKGFEIAVRYNSNTKKALRYFIEGNLSYYKSKILFNAEALQLNKGLYQTGRPIGQPLGLTAIGFYSADDIVKRAADPKSVPGVLTETIKAGDIKYADIGGPAGVPDGIIDGNDRTAIGKPFTPNWIAGLHGGLQYKGFDLDIVLQGVTGNSVNLAGNYFYAFQNNGQVAPIALDRWTPQTAATATYPRLSSVNNLNNYQASSFWQRDGSFIKLRSAEIGYSISNKTIQRLKLKAARIFVTGTNLFSIDRVKYGDPESLTGYPVLRTVTGGLRINL